MTQEPSREQGGQLRITDKIRLDWLLAHVDGVYIRPSMKKRERIFDWGGYIRTRKGIDKGIRATRRAGNEKRS